MSEEEQVAQAPSAEEPVKADKKKADEPLKPVPKPDDNDLKKELEAITEEISKKQERIAKIKDQLDARDNGRGDVPEVARAKAHLQECKSKSRMLQQEKRNIYDQISAADDLKKQQQDLTTRLKSQLSGISSVAEIDNKIKILEMQQQTSSLSIKEDKKVMEEIKRLSSNKPMIRQFDEAMESLKGVREHHTTLYTQLKAKNADLTVAKEEEEKWKDELDRVKAKEDAKRADIPAMFKERDGIRKEVNDLREKQRKLRDEFNEKRKEWLAYQKAVKDIKHKEWLEIKAKRQAEYEAQKKAWEEEEAKRDPWEEEKVLCEQLLLFCEKHMPKKEEAKVEAKEVEVPKGMTVAKKVDEEDPFAGLIKTKSKGKRKGGGGAGAAGGAAEPATPKSFKLKHSPDDFMLWAKLEMTPPTMSGDCAALHGKLLEKREWLKTAPPKKKKEKEAPKKEAKAAEAKAEDVLKEDADGNINYADVLKAHIVGALNSVTASQPSDPFKAMQQILFQASLSGSAPLTDVTPVTDEVTKYMAKYGLEVSVDDCLFKMKKRLVVGPADGFKFLLSDAGDFYTELSKKLKAAGGDLGLGMTAEELAAKDAADKKAKREKEAKAEAERDAADALNAERMAALEKSGKKATGGLHKFDASEVDVHGGDATADDFMDAFGF